LWHQELTGRRLVAQELEQKTQDNMAPITSPTRITHIQRYYGPSFRAMARDLPLTVTSYQLQLFLSKHGKVSNVEVLYYRKTKRSQGIGLFTMSTIHANVEDALEALNALALDGCSLNIKLVRRGVDDRGCLQ
jgi:RNA recognition motif-containing protein